MKCEILEEAPTWWNDYVDWPQQASFMVRTTKNALFFVNARIKKGLMFDLTKKGFFNIATSVQPTVDKKIIQNFISYCERQRLIPVIHSFKNLAELDERFKKIPVATVLVDLKRDVWKELNKKTRNQIRKSSKEGVEIREAETKKEYMEFYKIMMETSENKGFSIPPKEYFLKRIEMNNSKLFLAVRGRKIISGAMIFFFKDKIVLSISGTKSDAYSFYPSNLIYWKIIEWGKENGFGVFDLSGYDLNPNKATRGINKFKEGFGEIKKYGIYTTSSFYSLFWKLYKRLK
jgi:lipid II:glycine glycyltransferase (peptidoglycan interpeptide bridge formation enzyme)